jgi:hypothetical protein
MAGESKRVFKNITRVIDKRKRIDGFYVRIRWKGESYSKLFSLADYHDSEDRALEQAVRWRNHKELEIGKPRTERLIIGSSKPSNTGEKGISLARVRHRKNGKLGKVAHPTYVVTTFDKDGRKHRSTISIDKHGREKALRIARKLYKERSYLSL